MTVILQGAAGAGEGRLARRNLIIAKLNDWTSRHGHGSTGNVPSAMRYFEAKSVGDRVALCLVHFHQCGFLSLIGDWFSRTHAGPIENVQVVQVTLRFEQLFPTHGRFARNLGSFLNE